MRTLSIQAKKKAPRSPAGLRSIRISWLITLVLGLILISAGVASAAAEAVAGSSVAIRSGAEIDYPPFSIVTENGEAGGFSVELMRAALSAMGREVTFRTGPWAEVRGWLERGEIDALPLVGRTPEREALFDFTVPYMSLHGAIVVRGDETGIRDFSDLRGRQVAVMKGDNAEEFLRREARDFEIRTTPTFEVALQELAEGRHDAVVTQRLVALRLIQKTGLADLKVIDRPIEGFRQDFCFAVHEGDRDTLALLNEGLAIVVADGTYRRLHAKWFASLELPADRPITVGGDYNYPPFEYLDPKGRPTGFTVELIRAVAGEVNMDVRIQLGRWEDMVNALRDGRIDAIGGMFYSAERDRVLDFGPKYLVVHCVSVVRRGEGPPPTTLEELAGRDLVVQAEDAILDALAERGIEARITTVETQEDVVRAVAEGRNACGLATRLGALYAIRKHGWKNIELGDQAFYSGQYGFAVLQGNDALLAEFTEGLRMLKDSGEYKRLHEKWMGVYEKHLLWGDVLRIVAMIAGPLLLIALLALLWSWSLRRQVAEKTRALQESLDRFRYVFEASNAGKSMTLPTGEVNANQAFAEFLGFTPDELKGKRWQELTPPEDIEVTWRHLAPLLSGEKDATRFEKRYVHKSGVYLWADVSVVLRRDAEGNPLYFMTTVVDITEHKRDQLRIEHLNQVLRAIRDVNQLIVRERDRDRLIQEGCRLLVANRGYPSALIVLTDDEDRPVTWTMAGLAANSRELAALLEQGVLPACCGHTRAAKGVLLVDNRDRVCGGCPIAETCAESQSLCTPLSHEGETFGYLAAAAENHLVVDEEERSLFSEMAGDFAYALSVMRIEAAHRESESRFRAIVENAPDPIFIQTQMRFAYLNPMALDLFGAKEARELLGTPVMERFHPSYHEQVKQRIQTLNEDRKPVKDLLELEFLRLDGASVWVETTGQPIVYEGKNGALVFVRDISTRKRHAQEREKLQAQLIQAQKMESVGRLAGGVAHDYNNMLSVIIGFTELALDKVMPDEPLREDLMEVLNAARRSTDITRQLLAFARRQTIDPEVIDLNETVEGMLKMLSRLIGEDIDLSWQPGSGRMPVFMDPSQLDQLLANLCVNARDAIGGVGKLTIETGHVRFDAEYCSDHAGFIPGEFILLAVSDDGCGMDSETLGKIFEPFFTTKGVGEGTGLGLSTVFGIVKQNNGFINVYSEPEKGTTFKIYLPPYAGEDAGMKVQKTTKIPAGRGETVLIVEDETSILKLAHTILERLGYNVLTAHTPGEAVAQAEAHRGRIHLLITDVVMPEMNGRELAGNLQTQYADLKVLFMSGYTANVIAHRGVLDEGVNFIQKPFSNRDLAMKVREALES